MCGLPATAACRTAGNVGRALTDIGPAIRKLCKRFADIFLSTLLALGSRGRSPFRDFALIKGCVLRPFSMSSNSGKMAAVLSNLLALASIWHLVALAGASGLQDVRQARCLAFCALGPLRRHPAVFCISYSPALVSPGRAALAGAAPHTTKQSSILGGGRRHPVCSMLRARKRGPAGGKHAALLDAVSQGNFSAVQQALVAGGSTEAVDDWGTSCLHTAVKGGHTEVTPEPLLRFVCPWFARLPCATTLCAGGAIASRGGRESRLCLSFR